MRPNPLAPWELRIGHLRVYYDVTTDEPQVVTVRAIGVKVGNRVRVGEEWWELSQPQEAEGSHEDAGDEAGQG
jgi:hypothetical protein